MESRKGRDNERKRWGEGERGRWRELLKERWGNGESGKDTAAAKKKMS